MPTMNISLPEQLKEFVEAQVDSGVYTSASEYMRELVRRDLNSHERERIGLCVLAGIHSGEPIEMTPQAWDELRDELMISETVTKA